MFKTFHRFFALLSCAFAAAHLGAGPVDQTVHAVRKFHLAQAGAGVRVLLESHPTSVALRVEGGYGIYDPARKERITGGLLDKSFDLKAGPEGLTWGEAFPDMYQLTLVPEGQRRGFFLSGRFYPGILHAYQIEDSLQLVNEISYEEFSLAVLSAQNWENPPLEAAASLAICARTQAMTFAKERKQQFWHVEALRCGYEGFCPSQQLHNGQTAQIKTRDLALTEFHSSRLIPEWTVHCAGHTIDYDRMHSGDTVFAKGGTRGVASPWALADRATTKWSFTLSQAEFAKIFQLQLPFEIHLERDRSSQKVFKIVLGDASGKKALNFFRFQRKLPQLKSSEFTIEHERDEVVISGFGEGPGVGLCLFSSAAMAQEGKSAKEILEHFYPHSSLYLTSRPEAQ